METNEQIAQLRKELRKSALAARDAISPTEREGRSRQIAARLLTYLRERNVHSVHCYLSFRSEVETRDAIRSMLESGIRVTVPIVERIGTSAALGHAAITSVTEFQKGHLGIDEPLERTPASLETLDAVIIPLSAFDRTGTRLGYGMGFYDRFLHNLPRRVERIGLAFQVQEIPHIPALTHDEPLDLVVTENAIIHVD